MKWEYHILYHQNGRDPQYQGWNLDGRIVETLKGLSLRDVLDTLGKDGWELVSVVQEGDPDPKCYLKRPLS